MFKLKSGTKRHPERFWALPDRAFFGYGACHILAGAFLLNHDRSGFYAERIVPGDGFYGNHVFVTDGFLAFDYHGYSIRKRLLLHHTTAWAREYAEGWHCALERVNFDLLSTSELNTRNMRGPNQYLHDPTRRATQFIERIDHTAAMAKAILANDGRQPNVDMPTSGAAT